MTPVDLLFDLNDRQIIRANGSRGIGRRYGRRWYDPTGPRRRALRQRAWIHGTDLVNSRRLATPVFRLALVRVYVAYPKGTGRADPGNMAPTVKPLIDGLTVAGLWEDDDSRHLVGPDYRRDPNNPDRRHWTVRIHITETATTEGE